MNDVEEVKSRLDIVDVIGQYVEFQRAGRSLKALCPFHSERTPSFIVSPERQSWHCFGACGTGGDVISFVMRKEGLEFPDALRLLAQRAGVPLRERRASQEEDRARDRLRAANEAAAGWYRQLLLTSEAAAGARAYLERRGVDGATAEAFALGYSPAAWEAAREHLRGLGFGDEELLAAGLLVQGETGPSTGSGRSLHDRFRGRLMFPIRDARGRVVGFGARALDDSVPKYVNTSQTAIFDKGGMLYALDRAEAAIRREGEAVIVEGYMDAIAAHQHGFANVVASMGTALTERQVRLLKRLSGRIVLALDADAAGGEATARGLDAVQQAIDRAEEGEVTATVVRFWRGLALAQEVVQVDLLVAELPAGQDPDDLIRSNPEQWRSLVASARPLLDYRFDVAASKHDLSSPRGRSQAVDELAPLVGLIRSPAIRQAYIRKLADVALIRPQEAAALVRPPDKRRGPEAAAPGPRLPSSDSREEFLLALLLRYPELRPQAADIPEDLLWETENRQILAAYKESEGVEDVKASLPEELTAHLERLISRRLPAFDPRESREALDQVRRVLADRQLKAEKQATAALLAAREEELGASALVSAAVSATAHDGELEEAASLLRRDLEIGIKLHRRERSEDDPPQAGRTTVDD